VVFSRGREGGQKQPEKVIAMLKGVYGK